MRGAARNGESEDAMEARMAREAQAAPESETAEAARTQPERNLPDSDG